MEEYHSESIAALLERDRVGKQPESIRRIYLIESPASIHDSMIKKIQSSLPIQRLVITHGIYFRVIIEATYINRSLRDDKSLGKVKLGGIGRYRDQGTGRAVATLILLK